jgi:peptide/nickel transport system substrate-binding protein
MNPTLTVAYERFYDYIGDEGDTFLPANGPGPRKRYFDVMFDYLWYVDPETWDLLPGLAIAWRNSPDGLRWEIELRRDATWHGNRGNVTSADVRATLLSVAAEGSHSSVGPILRGMLEEVVAPDPFRVEIVLSRPFPALPVELSNYGWVPIAPLKALTDDPAKFDTNPYGSGPYCFKTHVPRRLMVFERRADHWRVDPHLDSISFISIEDGEERLQKFARKEIDICALTASQASANDLPSGDLVDIRRAANFIMFFGNRCEAGSEGHIWSDQRRRLAINLAIDAQLIGDQLFGGAAEPIGFSHTLPMKVDPPAYDPRQAVEVLRASGWDFDSESVEILSYPMAGAPEFPAVVDEIARQLRQLDLQVRVVDGDWATFQTELRNGKKTDLIWPQRFPSYFDPEPSLRLFYLQDARYQAYVSPELTELIEKTMPACITMEEKTAAFARLAAIATQDVVCLPLIGTSARFLVSDRVKNWIPLQGRYPVNYEYVRLVNGSR